MWITLWVRAGNSTWLKFGVWHSQCEILPSPKSWTQITFYSSPGLFIYAKREVWGSRVPHPFLPGWCPSVSSKQMLLRQEGGLFIPSSPERKQTSKQTKWKSNLRGHLPKNAYNSSLACSAAKFQALLVRVPLPELLAREMQFYPQSRVFLWHRANAVWLIHFLLCCISSGLLYKSEAYYMTTQEGIQEVLLLLWHWLLTSF